MIPFKKYFVHKLFESNEGDRVGIQHLYSHNKPELYSMSYENFKTFVSFLEGSNGIISTNNSTVSEKVDGMALKVGNDEKGFFVQSSYSGKVYKPEDFLTTIKYPLAQQAFINSFDKLKQIVVSVTKNKPCLIQLEWLYSPNATKLKDKPGMVSFVVANYHEHKLGSWSTFVILDVKSEAIDPLNIRNSLLKINNKEVKFLAPNVEKFVDINLTKELEYAKKALQNISEHQIPEKIEQLKGNRKRLAVQQRKQLERSLMSAILPIEKAMYEKIAQNLLKTEGILGDIEGYVIKAGSLMFKVNNPEFMKTKFEL